MNMSSDYPKIIYKYRSWINEYHRKILTENQVYLSSPSDFNDPFDCRIPRNFLSLDSKEKKEDYARKQTEKYKDKILERGETVEYRYNEYLKRLINDIEGQQKSEEETTSRMQDERYGILSLSGVWDNILMWSHYGDFHKGICVGFHEKLMRESRLFGSGGPVIYTENFPLIDPLDDDIMRTSFTQTHHKAYDWKYEEEYRLMKTFPKKASLDERIIQIPDEFFAEIILGVQFPKDKIPEIKQIAKSKNIPIYQAHKTPFKFKIERKLIQ